MVQLRPQQIEEYLDVHLPYRLRIMVAVARATRNNLTSDQGVLDACFIASLVTARVLLNVIGVAKGKNDLRRCAAWGTDVCAVALGGRLVDLSSLAQTEKAQLWDLLNMADQGRRPLHGAGGTRLERHI